MTETEIRAYLIDAYTAGVVRAREEYRRHKFTRHSPTCPCRKEKK